MKLSKRICTALLALILLLAAVPMQVSAGTGVQERIDKIRAVYPTGSYFTTTGYAHKASGSDCPSDCNICKLQAIPSRGGLPAGSATNASGKRWQCYAFASYVSYIVFGDANMKSWNTVSLANAKLGDVIYFSFNHWGIYLYTSGNSVVVYDGNYDYYCGVRYGSSYSASNISAIYHSPNYDTVNASSTEHTYTSITPGNYYLKNVSTGQYLYVSNAADANGQNIELHAFESGNTAEQFEITTASDGYKMRPLCSSSRLVNAYGSTPTVGANVNLWDDWSESTQWWKFEAVDGGYIIHNSYNPSCVLDLDDSNVLIWSRHGGASQIWVLESVSTAHTHSYTSYVYYGKTHPHYKYYSCSCGEVSASTSEPVFINTCEECLNTIRPNKPAFIDFKESYSTDDEIVFNWTTTSNTTHYNVFIEVLSNGEYHQYENIFYAENGLVRNLPVGSYRAQVLSYNSNYWEADKSDWIHSSYDNYYFVVSENDAGTFLLGDVDFNGKVNTTDARLTLQYAAGRTAFTVNQVTVADVDGNDKVNTSDARLILQYAAQRIPSFPAINP